MNKRCIWIAMLACVLMVSFLCPGTVQADTYEEFCAKRTFADDLPEEELPRPSRMIRSFEDFIYALDYLAFYRIGEAVYFEIDPEYAEDFYNPYSEFQKAYLRSDLADVYACQLEDSYYSQYGVVAIKYSMSRDIASVPPATIPDTQVVPSFDYHPAGDPELAIPLEEDDRTPISCENGEQLYYLVMNGYLPVPVEGSVAEQLYEEAKQVLRSCISPDMTDFEMIKAIYDWLTTEVVYDRATAYSSETYLVREQAYYLEGVFFYHCAVCDGKAKACALLLNMMGIPCYRETGVSEYGDHAWNVVGLDGKWYLLCTTYGQTDMSGTIHRIVPNDSMLLAGNETPLPDIWGYVPQKRPWLGEKVEDVAYPIFEMMSVIDEVDLCVQDVTELQELLEEIQSDTDGEFQFEFLYTGEEPEQFQEQMLQYLGSVPGVNVAEVKRNGGVVYQVIYLEE